MCTLVLFPGAFEGVPLVVAGNRDERLDRPAEGPALRRGDVLAPRDLEAGGTWWAFAPGGRFVGITNRFGTPVDPKRRSRGGLVDRFARLPGGFASVVDELASLDGSDWNGFHLVVAQGAQVVVAVGDGVRVSVREPGERVLVVSERSYGADPVSRDARVFAAMAPFASEPSAPEPGALLDVLAGHEPGFDGPCIHAPAIGYGTRSSFAAHWGKDRRSLVTTEGPPCSAGRVDATSLLAAVPC